MRGSSRSLGSGQCHHICGDRFFLSSASQSTCLPGPHSPLFLSLPPLETGWHGALSQLHRQQQGEPPPGQGELFEQALRPNRFSGLEALCPGQDGLNWETTTCILEGRQVQTAWGRRQIMGLIPSRNRSNHVFDHPGRRPLDLGFHGGDVPFQPSKYHSMTGWIPREGSHATIEEHPGGVTTGGPCIAISKARNRYVPSPFF